MQRGRGEDTVAFSRIGNNLRITSAPNVSEFSAIFDYCEKLNQNISGKLSYHAQKSIAGKMYDIQSVKYLNYTYCILIFYILARTLY